GLTAEGGRLGFGPDRWVGGSTGSALSCVNPAAGSTRCRTAAVNEPPRPSRNRAGSHRGPGAPRRPSVVPLPRPGAGGRRTPPNGRPRPRVDESDRGQGIDHPANPIARWLPVGAAGALLAVVIGVGVAGGGGGDDGDVQGAGSAPGVPIVPVP